ncbi:AMP-dependent synthetase/ligase [Streptomyces sp. DSM 44915]|uniref:AMP-dependent synthetase/ligase n=1 Tax=Streptomyces chisholmiae TaxID=3075540 RepID=A0ABU2JV47_9ACTN|nr:AMP-dependent synthetase/ligase [Streptomyces sp. DSM 44915]MDT0268088.1 AMP-dependent synthetase/ligase [Streptomyces sp. DSM 44915]
MTHASLETTATPSPTPELYREQGKVVAVAAPPLHPPPTHGSLADIPYVNALAEPTRALLSRRTPDGGWRDVTCREFAEQVTALAKGLVAHGLRPGDRLAVVSRTRYEWTLLEFAAWAAGLVTVPIYPESSPRELSWMLRDSGARACVVEGAEETRRLSAVRRELPGVEHVWQLTALGAGQGGVLSQIAAAGRQLSDRVIVENRERLTPAHAATLAYTSGTTGMVRGCLLTHGNLQAELDGALARLAPVFTAEPEGPEPSTLLFLPMAHVLGRVAALSCVVSRVRLGHASDLTPAELTAALATFRPTFLFAVPHLLDRVYNTARTTAETAGRGFAFERAARVARRLGASGEAVGEAEARPGMGLRVARSLYEPLVYRRIRERLGGQLRYVVCGGAPLSARIGAFFEGIGVCVYEGYGLTETSAAATVNAPGAQRLGTVGQPLPGMAVRIARDGRVLVRGPQVCAGYWDGATGRVVAGTDAEGWFATGDLGTLDDDGYLTVVGRQKELIVTAGGRTVVPTPVEEALRAHPLVSNCLLVGHQLPHLTALITLDEDGLAHWRTVHDRVRTPLSRLVTDPELLADLGRAVKEAGRQAPEGLTIRGFRVLPRDFTVEAGQLTPSLKVRRAAVLRDYADVLDELYRETGDTP